jgi:sugar phosphate isomerase/epimerase
MKTIGVSPAFFISRFSGTFSAQEIRSALPDIAALGFESVQLEIYRQEDLPDWTSSTIADLRGSLKELGLTTPQFVAHFLGEGFSSAETLARRDTEALRRTADIAASFDGCTAVTVPQPPFSLSAPPSPGSYRENRLRLMEKLHGCLRITEDAGLTLALEVLPYSMVGGSEGFLSLYSALSRPAALGFNLDTGHAWACKEPLSMLPLKLGNVLTGTHLSDNHAGESLSLKPGDGSIDWPAFLRSLEISGYTGSLDLEIHCRPELADSEYAAGREALRRYIADLHGG